MAEEFEIQVTQDPPSARLTGVMRLASPDAYRAVLAPLQVAIEAGPASYRLDLAGVSFMNSSGVTALSRLIMAARTHSVALQCVVDDGFLWQRKTLTSLQRLYPRIEIVKG